MFTELRFEKSIKWSRQRGMSRLGIDRLGNKAICFNQVNNHVPLTTIADEVLREKVDESVVNREV
jgi:hypothetical protein